MVSYKTTGDEHPMVMKGLFDILFLLNGYDLPFKKGRVTLTENGVTNEEGYQTLDLLYYDENGVQSEETPIVVVDEELINDIKSEIKYEIVRDMLREICQPIQEYLNSQDFEDELIDNFDDVGVKINVKTPRQIETPRGIVVIDNYDLLSEDIHQQVKESIIFE
jgi:hypothetical protein